MFDFETIRFISFFVVLNKHFGSVITRLGFDSHCKNPTAQFFFDSKDVMKYKSHFDTCFFEMRKKVTHCVKLNSRRDKMYRLTIRFSRFLCGRPGLHPSFTKLTCGFSKISARLRKSLNCYRASPFILR